MSDTPCPDGCEHRIAAVIDAELARVTMALNQSDELSTVDPALIRQANWSASVAAERIALAVKQGAPQIRFKGAEIEKLGMAVFLGNCFINLMRVREAHRQGLHANLKPKDIQ